MPPVDGTVARVASVTAAADAAAMPAAAKAADPARVLRWYVGYGSMMNPHSLRLRGIFPVASRPCVVPGHRVIFAGAAGMAAIRPVATAADRAVADALDSNRGRTPLPSPCHAVAHLITAAEFEVLMGVERGYDVVPVRVQPYGRAVRAAFGDGNALRIVAIDAAVAASDGADDDEVGDSDGVADDGAAGGSDDDGASETAAATASTRRLPPLRVCEVFVMNPSFSLSSGNPTAVVDANSTSSSSSADVSQPRHHHGHAPPPQQATDGLPSERYLDLLVQGGTAYGVAPAYVAAVAAHPCVPRAPPADFRKFPWVGAAAAGLSAMAPLDVAASAPLWTADVFRARAAELAGGAGDGHHHHAGPPIALVGVNGRAIAVDLAAAAEDERARWARWNGHDLTYHFVASVFFEPRYGTPSSHAEMSAPHRAWAEDFLLGNILKLPAAAVARLVGEDTLPAPGGPRL